MKPVTAEAHISLSADEYLKVLKNPKYEEHLDRMQGFYGAKVIKNQKNEDGSVTRTIRHYPKIDMPSAIQAVINRVFAGKPVCYDDTQTWYPDGRIFIQTTVPTFGSFTQDAWLELEEIDNKSCRHVLKAEITCGLWIVGGIAERFVAAELQKTYDQIPNIVSTWVAGERLENLDYVPEVDDLGEETPSVPVAAAPVEEEESPAIEDVDVDGVEPMAATASHPLVVPVVDDDMIRADSSEAMTDNEDVRSMSCGSENSMSKLAISASQGDDVDASLKLVDMAQTDDDEVPDSDEVMDADVESEAVVEKDAPVVAAPAVEAVPAC
eukprot:GFYU01002992.1.p1 GENE.GFYU01002992.1~~GFYU01002992.1.p1  ORF type:complete len:324 (+),score=105.90 GFYU01002992.1:155-1126(+)